MRLSNLTDVATWANIASSTITSATLYVLIGLSVVVTYRATRILNLASGQFLVLGSYLFYFLVAQSTLPIWAGLLVAVGMMIVFGGLTHTILMRPVLGEPLFVPAIVTLGLSLVLTSVVSILWGGDSRVLPMPFSDRTYVQSVGSGRVFVTRYDLVMLGVAAAVCLGLMLFNRYARFGLQMRAAAGDPLLASVSAIPINRVYVAGWAMGSVIAMLAGVTYAYTSQLTPDAQQLGLAALAPVIIAGFESIPALIAGSIIVGVVQSAAAFTVDSSASNAAAFAVLLILVLIRPRGLLSRGPGLKV